MFGSGGPGRDSISESEQRAEFAPANALRQMKPGEAVLLHGTLPPVHLRAVRWWNERELRQIIGGVRSGKAQASKELSTCPLTESPATESDEAVDERSFQATLEGIPGPAVLPAVSERQPVRQIAASRPSVATCERCRTELVDGEARYERFGTRMVTRCAPTCAERAARRSSGLAR